LGGRRVGEHRLVVEKKVISWEQREGGSFLGGKMTSNVACDEEKKRFFREEGKRKKEPPLSSNRRHLPRRKDISFKLRRKQRYCIFVGKGRDLTNQLNQGGGRDACHPSKT